MYEIVKETNDIPTKTIKHTSRGVFIIATSNKSPEIYILHLIENKHNDGNHASFTSMRANDMTICIQPTIEQSIEQMLLNGFRIFEFDTINEMAQWLVENT
jgi:hypothetical protein